MEYRNLGNTGLKVSIVGIGCNNFGRRCDAVATAAVVDAALDVGVNFFDSADIYGPNGLSEEYLGQAIKGKDRSSVIIASKFANPMGAGDLMRGASRRYIMNAVDASLKRLGTDYIDLYQQHVPDDQTPIEETLRALDDLVRSGKVRYIGHSNFSGWQLTDAHWTARHHGLNPFVTAQNHYSLIDRRIEKDVVPAAQHFGIGILPYFPLASGLLTGKYQRGEAAPQGTRLAAWGERGAAALSEQNFAIVDKLTAFAQAHDRTLLELAMSWLATKPYISSVIAGATSAVQVEQNAAAAAWRLSDAEMAEVNALSTR
ncbi:MAG: aldo/keto reductase [SAR86 cluster bacterium]|jgi:aryl-alcohol dehydrogenase-like predicted oxidoreductase|uniref:Aldo/keto reductase n=1 Tax=SAR86 cluster bacterium TaxID=2030880 RepID=A0A972VUM9_9GAMM|nr:aldo/keto reductase [SAR86 cluster bacterium]|tara:strand:+ start:1525 stop:2469 length:945 start_codon:yes stop_codon:yes gene_type:complete